MEAWAFKAFLGILSVVNPVGAIPIFMGLSEGAEEGERRKMASIAAGLSTVVLLAAALGGDHILRLFGISLASFEVGGGILLLLMAISMLHARTSHVKHSPEEAEEAEERESVAVVPLGLPILAGPGSISTVILYAQGRSPLELAVLSGAILGVGGVVWTSLVLAGPITERLGTTGINVVIRIMGLVLAAVAVEFMAKGLRELLPGLGTAC